MKCQRNDQTSEFRGQYLMKELYIEKGDVASTELSISHLDRVIAQNGGYPPPEPPGAFSATTARRQDMQLLSMVEQLEEKVAASSMQVKGWRPSRLALPEEATGAEIVARARHKLASVEAHIERRYLKPPLVQSTSEATLGAMLQAEHGNASATSPQNDCESKPETKGIARGLATWREALARCNTSAQLAMLLQALEAATAWDKSIMKALTESSSSAGRRPLLNKGMNDNSPLESTGCLQPLTDPLNCQFCLCGDNEEQLLLCDGCDKGYHTYCFKPRMERIPEGDWYCWECVNKARGDRVCIVCGGACAGRTIPCALCSRAYHQDCHYPPLPKVRAGRPYPTPTLYSVRRRESNAQARENGFRVAPRYDIQNPRGKWYCSQCIARAPPKKPRNTKKRDSKQRDTSGDLDQGMVPSPAASLASTSTTAEEGAARDAATPDKEETDHNHSANTGPPEPAAEDGPPEKRRASHYVGGNGAIQHDDEHTDGPEPDAENVPLLSRAKKEKNNAKKQQKELQFCNCKTSAVELRATTTRHFHPLVAAILAMSSNHLGGGCLRFVFRFGDFSPPTVIVFCEQCGSGLLCEMECHEHAWPFLVPVNTKQFPQYKKVIKCPMDLSTIKRKLHDGTYKCKEEFASDVRLIFSNCEVFNEDDSPVGRAGHNMRQFFDARWAQL
ncbi:hypothetical protein MSG28_015061 [Choristoneura fumiferana]|uniref:Uncharacterized protein n=1 Tax=Choristoneura fumiferana TaxID=7141 RepID=A0ACC0KYS8_CHOFU|nr:hypothetical protein MSG28_015061 [Choristoneura fumiferana]